MSLNFPTNPTPNQIYAYNNVRWKWNGYGWDSAGICGSLNVGGGICGDYVERITDGIGITLTSTTGVVGISVKLDEPDVGPRNTQIAHSVPASFSADSGFARKFAFLTNEGGITFDYIKNFDVFRSAEFQFDIVSFDIRSNQFNQPLNPRLNGIAGEVFNMNNYTAFIVYNQTPNTATINVLNATLGEQTGFPVTITTPGYFAYQFAFETVEYRTLSYNGVGPNNDYYLFRLGATGQDENGTLRYKTKDYILYFYNNILFGESQLTQLTSLPQAGFSSILSEKRNSVINYTITQDNQNPYYFYYAYPARLGLATFKDNTTNLEGGFIQQTGVISYTNQNNYTENYVVYRSENPNLGTINITVS
jgi:hypothetical protein